MILSAKYLFAVVVALAVIYFFLQKRKVQKEMLLFAVVSLPITYIVAKIAGHFYFDPRPFVVQHVAPLIPHAATNGFPSDHALISFAFAALLFIFNKKWGLLAGLVAIVVGISRVYVRVHSPIDIVGSFVIALSVAALVANIIKKYLRVHLRQSE